LLNQRSNMWYKYLVKSYSKHKPSFFIVCHSKVAQPTNKRVGNRNPVRLNIKHAKRIIFSCWSQNQNLKLPRVSRDKDLHYPTALSRVQTTLKTSTNITRYLHSRGPVRQEVDQSCEIIFVCKKKLFPTVFLDGNRKMRKLNLCVV